MYCMRFRSKASKIPVIVFIKIRKKTSHLLSRGALIMVDWTPPTWVCSLCCGRRWRSPVLRTGSPSRLSPTVGVRHSFASAKAGDECIQKKTSPQHRVTYICPSPLCGSGRHARIATLCSGKTWRKWQVFHQKHTCLPSSFHIQEYQVLYLPVSK